MSQSIDSRFVRHPLALLAFLAACSSSTSSTGTTGPTGSATPASLTVSVGDGQTGQPATALPIQPAVIVKDSASRPVSGVTVTFAVDSGGGSLSATSAVTGTDGIAKAGIWTLGPAEGRNTVKATAGALTAVKFAATAMIIAGSIPMATVGTGGGSVTVTAPGPLKGFELDVPAGALSTTLQVQVGYSSSVALPRAAGMTVASPIVTLTSNATGSAQSLYTLKIPATIPAGQYPIVAAVDPATGFLDALTTVAYDSVSVTATGTALDESQVLETSRRPVGFGGAAARLSPQVQYAVMLTDSAALHTITVDSHFLPGTDDWEFQSLATPVSPNNESGEVVSERYYFLNQKSQTSGSLWGRFEQTPGVDVSDDGGIQWTAALGQEFDGLLGPYAAKAAAGRTANQLAYDRKAIQTIAAAMVASGGKPQIVAFFDPVSGLGNAVLAYRWDGPSGTLYYADPASPGVAGLHSTWNLSGLGCTNLCVTITGLNHLIGYQTQLNGEFPSVVDATIDKGLFPLAHPASYDPIIGVFAAGVEDTLFMAHDTTRVWVECPTCAGSYPTTLPLQFGGTGIETQQVYLKGSSGEWATSGGQTQDGFFIDVTQFPTSTGHHFASFEFGIEALGLLRQIPGQLTTTGWLGWKTFQLIKFDPQLTYKQAITGLPATFTVSTVDGPALPSDATYQFKWGDGTPDTLVSPLPTTLTHTFAKAGPFNVVMNILHAGGQQVIGSASASVNVVSGPTWQLNGASLTSSSLPTLVNAHDTSEQTAVNTFITGVQGTPASTLIFGLINSTCSVIALEHFPAKLAVVDTGLVSGTTIVFAGLAPSCGTGGAFAMGPLGNGALTGTGPSGAVVNGFGDFIAGGSAAIDANMNGTALSGTITLSILYTGGTATYTIEFTAVPVSPSTISTSIRRH